MTPRFDPTRAVVFDFGRGQLKDDEGGLRLNLPLGVLARLAEQAGPDATRDFAHGLGVEIGRRIESRLGAGALGADLAAWAEHLGGNIALLGLGHTQLERWGRALVVRLAGAPREISGLLPALVESALGRASGRDVEVVAFEEDGGAACLVLSRSSARRARELAAAGHGLGSVVEALHRERAVREGGVS